MKLERLYRPDEVAIRYGCSITTARAYMRQMRHTEKPLTVRESDMLMWDEARTVEPGRRVKKQTRCVTNSKKRSASVLIPYRKD